MEKLVPINIVAEYLGVSPKNIYYWIHIGFIPHYRFPKLVRFKMTEVENYSIDLTPEGAIITQKSR